MNAEQKRLAQNDQREERWHLWGPYLAERHGARCARTTARTAKPGIIFRTSMPDRALIAGAKMASAALAITSSDFAFAFAFWNERDPILKERLFGLTGPQGNHGEDVKEIYFYTRTTRRRTVLHADDVSLSAGRFSLRGIASARVARAHVMDREFELWDTDVLRENGFFEIDDRICESGRDDILIRVTRDKSCDPEPDRFIFCRRCGFEIHGAGDGTGGGQIYASGKVTPTGVAVIEASHHLLGEYRLYCEGATELALHRKRNATRAGSGARRTEREFVKDAFHEFVVRGKRARGESGANRHESGGALPLQYTWRAKRERFDCGFSNPIKRHDSVSPFADFDECFSRSAARKRTNSTTRLLPAA